jgi:hypothetical protein
MARNGTRIRKADYRFDAQRLPYSCGEMTLFQQSDLFSVSSCAIHHRALLAEWPLANRNTKTRQKKRRVLCDPA